MKRALTILTILLGLIALAAVFVAWSLDKTDHAYERCVIHGRDCPGDRP